jgi:hypothetical protein
MKTSSIIKSIAAAILLLNVGSMLIAQTANNNTCPLGNQPGYCQTLTPEQRMVYRAAVQKYVSELKQKQANNQLTTEEQAWLKNLEQRGGMMGFGPKGAGMGRGQGKGMGPGQGMGRRMGACDGTGPKCGNNGICPLGNRPATTGNK